VTLNLAASLVTVAAAAAARVVVAPRGAALEHLGVVAVAMALGGMIGARSGSPWLAHVSESDLRRIVRGLLAFIGVLLVIEVVVAWPSPGLPLGDLGRTALGVVAGIVSSGRSAACSASPAASSSSRP
jgi:hypothetical protein